jgi:hypothetical protein
MLEVGFVDVFGVFEVSGLIEIQLSGIADGKDGPQHFYIRPQIITPPFPILKLPNWSR